jgi:hypothetical protein
VTKTPDPHGFNLAAPLEPSANHKEAAYMNRSLFIAHLEQGFDVAQAVEFTKFTIEMAMRYDDGEEYSE